MIALSNINKNYGPVPIIRSLDLAVPAGAFVALLGKSGSGKSTVLNIIAGLDRSQSGTVVVNNTELQGRSNDFLSRFRLENIGLVFQFFNLLPTLTIAQNVAIPALLRGLAKKEVDKRVATVINAVGLASCAEQLPSECSGGEVQRAAIARALINNPSVILADEPTGNLDSANATGVFSLFRSLVREEGVTTLVVTHDQGLAQQADFCFQLENGAISK